MGLANLTVSNAYPQTIKFEGGEGGKGWGKIILVSQETRKNWLYGAKLNNLSWYKSHLKTHAQAFCLLDWIHMLFVKNWWFVKDLNEFHYLDMVWPDVTEGRKMNCFSCYVSQDKFGKRSLKKSIREYKDARTLASMTNISFGNGMFNPLLFPLLILSFC